MIRLSRVSLGVCAVAFALTASRPVFAAEVDKLLPTKSDMVVYVNVRQLLDSEIVKKYAIEQIKQVLAGNDAQKVLTQMGLDPLKDVDRVIMGVSFGDDLTKLDPTKIDNFAIIRGKFDADKLYKAAEQASKDMGDKFTLVKEGDTTLLKIQTDNNPNPSYGTLIDKNTLVIGSKKEAVLKAVSGEKQTIKPALAALITQMDEKASLNVAWAVGGKLGAVPVPGANDPTVQKSLEKTESIALMLNVTSDVNVDVGLGMKDDDSATSFGKLIEQGLQQAKGLLPLLVGNEPKMKPLAELGKTLASDVKGKQISITAKLTGEALAKSLNPGE